MQFWAWSWDAVDKNICPFSPTDSVESFPFLLAYKTRSAIY